MATTMTAPAPRVHASPVAAPPDPEVPERPQRRRFTVEYKLGILAEADRATAPGAIAAMLRREGLYSSHLAAWRAQRDAGALAAMSPRRGRRPNPLAGEVTKLRRQNERLRTELEKARLVIDVQKKVSRLLGIPLEGDEER